MTRALIWVLRALGGLLLLLALVSGGAVFWLRGSLPKTEGTVVIAGLAAPVEVLRDGDGFVTIRARNETDAMPSVWGAIRLPRNQVLRQNSPITGRIVIYRTGLVPDSY